VGAVNDGSFAPCAIYAARSSKPREHRRRRHATGAGNRDRHHHDGTARTPGDGRQAGGFVNRVRFFRMTSDRHLDDALPLLPRSRRRQ
jgi:hypothetical protein